MCMGKTWEYDRKKIGFGKTNEVLEKGDALGDNGWEIISYEETKPEKLGEETESVILIKREKSCTKEKQ